MIWRVLGLLSLTWAYRHEDVVPSLSSIQTAVADECIMYATTNETVLEFKHQKVIHPRVSNVVAINQQCDRVLFGYPNENKVVMWKPYDSVEMVIEPSANVFVDRFGWSLDIQGHSWVVGAPGTPNDASGNGATLGYAFVYHDTTLHSCRSLYDTYSYKVGETEITGFKAMKDANGFSDGDVPAFQRQCSNRTNVLTDMISSPIPLYNSITLIEAQLDYFEFAQFGYAVALTGPLYATGSGLFISAPGDTQRFMEDNDGKNYGRVYMWDSFIWDPQDESLPTISWWKPSVFTPLIPPTMAGVTYRAFGRSIGASRPALAVGSYPLYDTPRDDFIFVYECHPELDTDSHCERSGGVSLNDLTKMLRSNVLGYMTPAMKAYTDGKDGSYIPSNTPGDGLPDFQNQFVGSEIGITGSNVMIPDIHHNKVYRFGVNGIARELHTFVLSAAFATNSEHWTHLNSNGHLTHQWNCPLGQTGGRSQCIPCSTSYYSDDGWLAECDPCPVNFTTNQTGQSYCHPWTRPIPPGMTWEDTLYIIIVISVATLACFLCWCLCQRTARTPRRFVDTIV